MVDIDLLSFGNALKYKKIAGNSHLWDPIRKRFVLNAPEELVRQLMIRYLIDALHYPQKLIQVEKQLVINDLIRRFDILVYDRNMQPFLLVECKAPKIEIGQAAFDQIARYNIGLKVPYMLVTNGRIHYCCSINHEDKSYAFLEEIPNSEVVG
ncbi:MAG: type I restriction enzyme HsdR N-terminal domain-containing protein [Saprospiraceae bacterium]|nr:type I restriction enzyme HsdR N-terminal domain-containing protein [Saprospiraceae bacterium]